MMQRLPWFIFVPWLASLALAPATFSSYLIAWLGSIYIFYVTWIRDGNDFSEGLSIADRFMKPIFLLQAIFAGFMCLTSIFYFIENLNSLPDTILIAKCQRLSLLAHIGLVMGIYLVDKEKSPSVSYTAATYLKVTVLAYGLGFMFSTVNGLFQFSIYFFALATIAGAYLLVKGIKTNNFRFKLIGAGLFVLNFISSTLTGFKESIIVNVIILFVLLFPIYKRLILVLSLPALYLLLYILPTYAGMIRTQSWSGDISAEEARNDALDFIISGDKDNIAATNWEFLTNRLSEINMFTQFVDYVPEKRDFYHLEIVENAVVSLIPRVVWPNKPITEQLAMERVYDAEVASKLSSVSAKTRPVVDGYLSFGAIGVFISIFIYGLFAQWAFNKAESLFGGYELGGIIVFNGIFQSLWRGNNFEFILNNMVYGVVSMYLFYWIVTKFNILQVEE